MKLALPGWLGLIATILLPGVACAAEPDVDRLTQRYCGACHLMPDPGILSRDIWRQHVLPNMGVRLGVNEFRGERYRVDTTEPEDAEAAEPLISLENWATIHDHYVDNAPVKLPRSNVGAAPDLDLFDLEQPRGWSGEFKGTTSLLIDEAARRLILGDASNKRLVVYSSALQEITSVTLGNMPMHIGKFDADYYIVTMMDTLMASDARRGSVAYVRHLDRDDGPEVVTLLESLPRPIQSVVSDFDSDGRQDVLVAGFGHTIGELALYHQRVPGEFSKQTLIDGPGAIAAHRVSTESGFVLFVLFAQDNERILRISEKGDIETIMRFHPARGSSSLEVVDFDGDGDHDMLYTSGDNGDISRELKPYHGVALILDDGEGRYEQAQFFPMNGAYKALAEDFDGDGDRDIVAVAYFGDYGADPDSAGFVFWENQGDLRFRARTIRGVGALGRFITMATGDLDRDGDIDIVLGSFTSTRGSVVPIPDELAASWATAPPFVVLRNRLSDR